MMELRERPNKGPQESVVEDDDVGLSSGGKQKDGVVMAKVGKKQQLEVREKRFRGPPMMR